VQATLSLRQRAAAWRKSVDGPASFARRSAWIMAGLGLALLARFGTAPARVGALVGCAVVVLLALVAWWLRERRASDVRRLVRQVIVPTDAVLGARALRAAGLVARLDDDAPRASRELARFHLDKVIEGASLAKVESTASRRALWYRGLGGVCAFSALVVGVFASREVAEGFDVLVTHGARAPVPMFWTERLRIMAQPPAYLRIPVRRLAPGASSMLPAGTSLTLRARPLFQDRHLVVTDGQREVPFVSDGEGGLVAHYAVEDDATLVVAARFGDVLITEPQALRIIALPDETPRVILEDAPQTIKLRDLERLELRWRALDDHGISQVDLVLRSGTREERRVLASYDDEGSVQQGGHVLLPSDPFLRSLYVPARVSIEAQDNDPAEGSKWGRSEAFEIVPTAVGEPDAARYLALVLARDRFVDVLASVDGAQAAPAAGDEARYARKLDGAVSGFQSALSETYGGLRVPPGLRSFALGRLELLTSRRGPEAARAQELGDLILAVDGALSSLSSRDAQRVSKLLAEVAEEAMVGAQQARGSESPEAGLERLDRAIFALRAGAEQLLSLGTLGNDLGSVALADLGRVRRGREAGDLYHAELAARHLADRLRRPTPSFGASGAGGVEAGQPQSGSPDPSHKPDPSGAQQQFDDLAREIADLAREHAGAVEQVDQTLSDARSRVDDEALRAEAERRAGELRDRVEGLPEPGTSPGTAEAAAALGREHARAMAHNMESLRLQDAAENGRRALGSLSDVAQRTQEGTRLRMEADAARAAVQEQLAWAESQIEAARNAARDKSRDALSGPAALEEELAGTAAALAQRGQTDNTPLPADVTERLRQADQLMRQAARALESGEGETGLSLQREAQRLLEQADPGKTSDPDPDEEQRAREDDDVSGNKAGFGGEVPDASEQNKAEEFRRRVLESLGDNPTGPLGPAIKRYAEGLLR
jgi:hypothetical protein